MDPFDLAEQSVLPDRVIRAGMRRLLAGRLRQEAGLIDRRRQTA